MTFCRLLPLALWMVICCKAGLPAGVLAGLLAACALGAALLVVAVLASAAALAAAALLRRTLPNALAGAGAFALLLALGNGRHAVRLAGTAMAWLPLKYCPVSDSGAASTCANVPCAMMRPPCMPAPGPMSMMWSAARIMSSSCSTTSTLLPISRRCFKVAIRRSLSRWCRPMLGSSSTYITPVSPLPIWLASRMRCASPPLKVSALRLRLK